MQISIPMTKVESSNIREIGWIEKDQFPVPLASDIQFVEDTILRVVFKNKDINLPDRTYDYKGVRKEVFESFLESKSKGQFFNLFINKKYKFVQRVVVKE